MARVVDPVCKMKFEKHFAVMQSVWSGRIFYFCHPICKKIFDAHPSRFVNKNSREKAKILKPSFARGDSKPAA